MNKGLSAAEAAGLLQGWAKMPDYVPPPENRALLYNEAARLLLDMQQNEQAVRALCEQALEPLQPICAGDPNYVYDRRAAFARDTAREILHDGREAFARDLLAVLEKQSACAECTARSNRKGE